MIAIVPSILNLYTLDVVVRIRNEYSKLLNATHGLVGEDAVSRFRKYPKQLSFWQLQICCYGIFDIMRFSKSNLKSTNGRNPCINALEIIRFWYMGLVACLILQDFVCNLLSPRWYKECLVNFF